MGTLQWDKVPRVGISPPRKPRPGSTPIRRAI